MENVCITPKTERVALILETAKIINRFNEKGFMKRLAFINIVKEMLPEFDNYDNIKRLEHFWVFRVQDEVLNNKLNTVLTKLDNE